MPGDESPPGSTQREYWNAEESRHWVDDQDRYDAMLEPFVAPLLDAVGLRSEDRVLDVGCGCGATTLAAAHVARYGDVLGLDLSEAMTARARARASEAGLTNVSFEVGDAQDRAFSPDRDAIISRFGVMFFTDPIAAFANLRRALVPGGRLAFVCWQGIFDNEWMTVPMGAVLAHVPAPVPPGPGRPGPFSLADADQVREVLRAAGFARVEVDALECPMLLAGYGTVDDAVAFLRRTGMGRLVLGDVDAPTEAVALDALRGALAPYATPQGVRLGGAAWLVRTG
jgi:SAM-dependent methyltransferase